MVRTRLYREGVLVAEGFPIAEVSDHVADPGNVVWFDLCAPTADDLGCIAEELGLHTLAVEDVFHERQRPKVDVYDGHLFVAAYWLYQEGHRLHTVEIDMFLTANALVTVRENEHFDIDQVTARWDASGSLAKNGVAFLLYGLLDYVVDGHYELVERLDEEVEALEEQLFEERPMSRLDARQMFTLRKNMVGLRKVAGPMREVVNTLFRRDLHVVTPEMTPYYQDLYDHVLRVAEWIDNLRDLVANLREAQLSQQGFRLNEIMKKLTGWAAVIAVPTMITGFYGQNVPYPGFGTSAGFWWSSIIIVAASGLLYLAFKKRDWL
ncbi:magnesium transporter CorA family protein [Nonomuraea sp. NPDC003804]|uniref:magnesium transporter CorA family protein n=1 Tax=Nonomuraea sp. NPDC003804 TaxID=3154547 RepID=UPI0033B2331C